MSCENTVFSRLLIEDDATNHELSLLFSTEGGGLNLDDLLNGNRLPLKRAFPQNEILKRSQRGLFMSEVFSRLLIEDDATNHEHIFAWFMKVLNTRPIDQEHAELLLFAHALTHCSAQCPLRNPRAKEYLQRGSWPGGESR